MESLVLSKEQAFKEIIASDDLPTLPIVASQMLTLLANEKTTFNDIADLISIDLALSAKVLKVVNSAFYSFPNPISSISHAISILGTNAVRNLVLSFSFFSLDGRGHRETEFDFEEFWIRSLTRAVAAKFIQSQLQQPESDNSFVCGLLQNLGKLIFACTLSNKYEKVLEVLKDEKNVEEDNTIELDKLGVDHSFVSYKITEQWGFPNSLVQPLKYHHTPTSDAIPEAENEIRQNIRSCYLSELLVNILHSNAPERHHKQFRADAKQLLGLNVLTVNNILKNVHTLVDQTAESFGFHNVTTLSVEKILQEANLKLSLLNISYEEMNRRLIESKTELEKLTRELERKNKILENLAFIDGLTEVNNHRFFQNVLDKEVDRVRSTNGMVSLVMIDIDHFKGLNDTYGHQTGDFVLKQLCVIINEYLRDQDLLARYGGEEFVLVLPNKDSSEAAETAELIREAIAAYRFIEKDKEYRITISLGVAGIDSLDEEFIKNDLIRLADEALYQAKNTGRNRVVVTGFKKKKGWFS